MSKNKLTKKEIVTGITLVSSYVLEYAGYFIGGYGIVRLAMDKVDLKSLGASVGGFALYCSGKYLGLIS